MQVAERAREEQSGRDVAPVAVENIARDDQKRRPAVDRLPDQLLDRVAIGPREPRRDRGILEAEAGERAVDMQIGGMDEMELHAARLAGIGGQRNWRGRSAHRREAEPLEERAYGEFVGFM